jgi:hypothetical protein
VAWDRQSVINFSMTCHRFHNVVNSHLYKSVVISQDIEMWDKLARLLPKYGHLTREIYFEDYKPDVQFDNLRAIGDFCPNLERLDLNYKLRLDLAATELDLPPKIGEDPTTVEASEESSAHQIPIIEDSPPNEESPNGGQAQEHEDIPSIPRPGDDEDAENSGDVEEEMDTEYEDDEEEEEEEDGDDYDDDEEEEEDEEEEDDVEMSDEDDLPRMSNPQRRVCAEIDYIVRECAHLENFSIQWTAAQPLSRFYQKIPKLKGLRIWDPVKDEDLIRTATHCQELERFFLDRFHPTVLISPDGLIAFINALPHGGASKLKRLGFNSVSGLISTDVEDTEDSEDSEDTEDAEDAEEAEDGNSGGVAEMPMHIDHIIRLPPIIKFIDALSFAHPFLERLALIHVTILNSLIPILGRLTRLQSLDLSSPSQGGLSTKGIRAILESFKGKSLSSLDLTSHTDITVGDMERLVGEDGLKTLRYVRVQGCPHLEGRYTRDEWVHPDDVEIVEGGDTGFGSTGKGKLEIGEGWKEHWSEYY